MFVFVKHSSLFLSVCHGQTNLFIKTNCHWPFDTKRKEALVERLKYSNSRDKVQIFFFYKNTSNCVLRQVLLYRSEDTLM
jgi:hypothetical protein